jgi:hypothetical protein
MMAFVLATASSEFYCFILANIALSILKWYTDLNLAKQSYLVLLNIYFTHLVSSTTVSTFQ